MCVVNSKNMRLFYGQSTVCEISQLKVMMIFVTSTMNQRTLLKALSPTPFYVKYHYYFS